MHQWAYQPECLITDDHRRVITIPGTYYIKVSVCDQEEKFYGSFVVEDDTGGIMVLRDSRVSQVQPGDVVRMTVHSMAVSDNLGPHRLRAILSYDLEILGEKDVLYERTTDALGTEHAGRTMQVEGHTIEKPTNLNFSTMVLSNLSVRPMLQVLLFAEIIANQRVPMRVGAGTSDVCETRICPVLRDAFDENLNGRSPPPS